MELPNQMNMFYQLKNKIMKISEGNKLIAEFMGETIKKHDDVYLARLKDVPNEVWHGLFYHSDWNMLMPVVEKIEKYCVIRCGINYKEEEKCYRVVGSFDIDYSKEYPTRTTTTRLSICTELNGIGSKYHIIKKQSESKIQSVYETVVDFIKWHNEQK